MTEKSTKPILLPKRIIEHLKHMGEYDPRLHVEVDTDEDQDDTK